MLTSPYIFIKKPGDNKWKKQKKSVKVYFLHFSFIECLQIQK